MTSQVPEQRWTPTLRTDSVIKCCLGRAITPLRGRWWIWVSFLSPSIPHFFWDRTRVWSRGTAVDMATSYKLYCPLVGVQVLTKTKFFSYLCRPDRLWGPLSLQSNGYRGLFLRELSGWDVKLTTHLQLVPRWRVREPTNPLPPYALMA
jgi:hypothetical protein